MSFCISRKGRKRQARQAGRGRDGGLDLSSRLHFFCLRSIDCQTRRSRRPRPRLRRRPTRPTDRPKDDITTWSIARSSTDSVTRPSPSPPSSFLPSSLPRMSLWRRGRGHDGGGGGGGGSHSRSIGRRNIWDLFWISLNSAAVVDVVVVVRRRRRRCRIIC